MWRVIGDGATVMKRMADMASVLLLVLGRAVDHQDLYAHVLSS